MDFSGFTPIRWNFSTEPIVSLTAALLSTTGVTLAVFTFTLGVKLLNRSEKCERCQLLSLG